MDEALATTALVRYSHGDPPAKRVRRKTAMLQQRLSTICRRRDGDISIEDCQRGVGHTVRLCNLGQ